ncbi:hypothetical protein LV476_07245 [Guyparkeria hydrothermalis]|uniref:hypothetical protein n=1 Tax=Guyparkeria hydrothermalis TaxID=923 RepID=UPI002021BA34|nr:hypothetical protein [Guyparkeria hydrothermalis]MCL7744739.1 hypothetical protein [Guyparkeria hydrothermalis]
MRLVAPLLFALLFLGVHGGVAAKSVEGRYVAFGPGNWNCEDAVAVAEGNHPGSQGRLNGFIAGYLSAANVILSNTYDIQAGKPASVAKRRVLAFCRDNPSVKLANALAVHTQRQYADRQSVPSQK